MILWLAGGAFVICVTDDSRRRPTWPNRRSGIGQHSVDDRTQRRLSRRRWVG